MTCTNCGHTKSQTLQNRVFLTYNHLEYFEKPSYGKFQWDMLAGFSQDNKLGILSYDIDSIYFDTDKSDIKAYPDLYKNIKEKVTEKYGDKTSETENWSNEKYKNDPGMLHEAINLNHYSKNTTWETSEINIKLSIENGLVSLTYSFKNI